MFFYQFIKKGALAAALLFHDAERGNKVLVAVNRNLEKGNLILSDLISTPVGGREPVFDTELWKNRKILDLFVQKTIQADGEGQSDTGPQPVCVIEWKPL